MRGVPHYLDGAGFGLGGCDLGGLDVGTPYPNTVTKYIIGCRLFPPR
jgi:hypothetical protein